MRPTLVAVSLVICLGALSARAQQPRRVLLVVQGEESIADRTKSFLNREPRELPNIEVVKDHPKFTISVFVATLQRENGRLDGYAVSYVFFRGGDYFYHHVIPTDEEDLKVTCEKIVATFDTRFLAAVDQSTTRK